jgi:integrase
LNPPKSPWDKGGEGVREMKRFKTAYPGVFYRLADRIGGKGKEKVYFVVFKKDGEIIEERAGRQFANDMTPARAAGIRGELIEGKRIPRREIREKKKAEKKAKEGKWTFNKLWEEYKRQKTVYKGIGPDANRFNLYVKPSLGDKEPKEVLPLDLDRIRLKGMKGKSPQSIKLTLALVRRLARFGARKRLSESMTFEIEMPTVHNEKTEDLTPEQLASLLKAIEADTHPHAGPMIRLALFSGMRRGEMFKLQWSHIDFDRGFITLKDPKGGPDQKIPLNAEARKVLESHPKTDGSLYVFPGRKGERRTDINKALRAIKDAASLPEDFRILHGCRHVYASMLASSGKVDMYTLQKLMTHKSPGMTQRYAHLRDDALRRASDLAAEIIRGAAGGAKGEAQDQEGRKVIQLDETRHTAEV